MAGLSVIELWGVASQLTKRLNGLGIHTVLDLARADPVRIRDRFSVVLMRTVLELQGTPCIPLEEERTGRHQLIFSRSFSTPSRPTAAGLRQVFGVYAQQASARLATHGLQAKVLTAFAATSHYNPQDSSNPTVCVGRCPCQPRIPVLLARAAYGLLPPDPRRCAVTPGPASWSPIFVPPGTSRRCNSSRTPWRSAASAPFWRKSAGRTAGDPSASATRAPGRGRTWSMKRDMLSPRYTTHWEELPIVRAA